MPLITQESEDNGFHYTVVEVGKSLPMKGLSPNLSRAMDPSLNVGGQFFIPQGWWQLSQYPWLTPKMHDMKRFCHLSRAERHVCAVQFLFET